MGARAPSPRIDLLRFATAGSVDDGKSTLIGRLLYESRALPGDQLDAVRAASARRDPAGDEPDLALVTDGLRAEREQGITIDVAYRYFATPRRKFIIADTPGHEQYTRNMATGASTADLAVVLVDASRGVLTQSRRHAFLAALLGIPHLVVTVNKMDLAGFSRDVFDAVVADFQEFAAKLEMPHVTFIPVSALEGDNVVKKSERMPWYGGRTLLDHLETVHIASDRNLIDLRFPVQYVSRDRSGRRGYMGTPASGVVRPGDRVAVLPSGLETRVRSVAGVDGRVEAGFPPLPVTLELDDELDVARGDVLVHPNNVPRLDRSFEAMVVWMDRERLACGRDRYLVKHLARAVPARVAAVRYRMDVDTLHRVDADALGLNEIGRCVIELARPAAFDSYRRNRKTGAFILIDRRTHATAGAGMILDRDPNPLRVDPARRVERPRAETLELRRGRIGAEKRAKMLGHGPFTVWFTGLTGSGKTTLAYALEHRLFDLGVLGHVLDGENLRLGVSKDLGFSADDRAENIRRAAELAALSNRAGLVAICALVSPYREERARAREIVGPGRFVEILLSAPAEVCRARSRPGLYERAEAGEIGPFPGVSAPYEPPEHADLVLATSKTGVDGCVEQVLALLRERGWLS